MASAAELAHDVTLVITNAGFATGRNLVIGMHLGAADTADMAGHQGQMLDPADVARAGLDGVEAGKIEVLVDEWSTMIKATLANDPAGFYATAVGA